MIKPQESNLLVLLKVAVNVLSDQPILLLELCPKDTPTHTRNVLCTRGVLALLSVNTKSESKLNPHQERTI